MPSIEGIKRKAQSVAYAATEKAQGAVAAAGEKAGSIKELAGEKAGTIKAAAGEKAGAIKAAAGEKAGAIKDTAKTGVALMSEKRSLDNNFRAIGEWYVSTLGDDVPDAVADVVSAIRASQARIRELEAQKADAAEPEQEPEQE